MAPSQHRPKHIFVIASLLLLCFIWVLKLSLPARSAPPQHLGEAAKGIVPPLPKVILTAPPKGFVPAPPKDVVTKPPKGVVTAPTEEIVPAPPEAGVNITAKNVAAIIETRSLENMVPLLLHFSSVLGPNWPIVLFTPADNIIPASAPLHQAINDGRISLQLLPADTEFASQLAVSEFLTSPWLWEQLAPASHVLIFQADSMVCASSDLSVDDFLEYDFVGAPIRLDLIPTGGYNGGLSLRNRSMMLDIIRAASWKKEYDAAPVKTVMTVEFEDQWFHKKMKELPDRPNGEPGARLPPMDVAKTFAVETVWYETPLGYHQAARWQEDHMAEVYAWCPEYQMATSELFANAKGTG